ncbi:MAG TPA: FAD:protein FMN transferase [Marinobacter sp.]|nr:FAD:protein FMN transferase [Marinobacter sp.]
MLLSMVKPARAAVVSVFFALAMAALAGCSFKPEQQVWEISGPIFGTRYHISVVMEDNQARLQQLASGIDQALEGVDAAMSTWREDSELSRFNARPDQSGWTDLSAPLHTVLREAEAVSVLTQGAFDITIGPVVNLWGFGPNARPDTVPDDAMLAQVLSSTGHDKIELRNQPPGLRTSEQQYLDLSAIAKGYGVDEVARYLAAEGVSGYLVEIGGEVSVAGRKPDGSAWRLAIETPGEEAEQVNRVIALDNGALATSGDYRNYYEFNGQRYSHTLNPQTGKPITHNLASVTVIAENCMRADALATGFNVMGFEDAMALAIRENIPAYFIVRGEAGFETHHTPAFSSFITQ